MSAAGRVCTGFSKPWIAKYSATGSNVSYSGQMEFARGVDVEIAPDDVSDDNTFYANNQAAENVPGKFTGGALNLTVDGLHDEAEKMAYGLPTPENITVNSTTVGVTHYGDSADAPYLGFGFVARYMSDGAESYVGYVLPKIRFKPHNTSAATQAEEIEWHTQSLEAAIFRCDNANHDWKWSTEEVSTEALAEAAVKKLLGSN